MFLASKGGSPQELVVLHLWLNCFRSFFVSVRVHSRLLFRLDSQLFKVQAFDRLDRCLEDFQPGIPFVV